MFAFIAINALKKQDTEYKESGEAHATSTDASKAMYEYGFGSALHDGYYLVEDITNLKEAGTDSVASKIMVKVMGPTVIETKENTAPTITKDIVLENGQTSKFDDVAIGDTVKFQLKSAVPDMSGYNKYFFIMDDKLSEGLTYDKDKADMKITVGNKTLEATDYYVVVGTEGTATTLKIVFKNFIQYAKDAEVTVTYNATVNSNVVVGKTDKNNNSVKLTYSNNPNITYVGKSNPDDDPNYNEDEEGGDEPDDSTEKDYIGETPWSTVYVYSTALNVIKVNKDESMRLAGAKFTISGTKLNQAYVTTYSYKAKKYYVESDDQQDVSEESSKLYLKTDDGGFEKNPLEKYYEPVKYNKDTKEPDVNGTLYKTTAGDFTEEFDSKTSYVTDVVVYERTATPDLQTISTETVNFTGTTGEDGEIYISGLSAGIYKLTEVTAPDGYNLLENPITVKVTCTVDANSSSNLPIWKFEADKNGGENYSDTAITTLNDGTGELKVQNSAGTTLPSTGGMGTTIFYVLGSILMAGAVILLISKRRMSTWNQ
jgi:fimbrial isopeptide formation D2 family protein/LPXTG-motif cell wall-anchored protein